MSSAAAIRSTARASNFLFRHAFPVYRRLYDAYKRTADRAILDLLQRSLRPGDRVVDIGANVGFYAEVLARLVGEDGRVYAFEPAAENFDRLAARTQRYRQVRPVRAAVTDHVGATALYLSSDLNVDHRTYRTDDTRRTASVDAVSLDAFFAADTAPLRLIKMDIQGAEHAALLGMQNVVARSPGVKILLELWPFVYERYGNGTQTILRLLESWGFEMHRLGNDRQGGRQRLSADAPLPEREDPDAYFDVLCVRAAPSRADSIDRC
jgi:FkbM family methyltransferase